MSFRAVVIIVVCIAIVAAGVGGGTYYVLQKRQAQVAEQIAELKKQMPEGDLEEALASVESLLRSRPPRSLRDELCAMQIELLWNLNQIDRAGEAATAFLKARPASPGAPAALLALGKIALARDEYARAREYFERVTKEFSATLPAQRAQLGLAKIMAKDKDLQGAREKLEQLMNLSLPPDIKDEVEKELGAVNVALLFSRATTKDDIVYQLLPGDSLSAIAKKHNIPMELLMRKNNIDTPRRLSSGSRVLIPINEFSIVIDRFTNTLTLLDRGKFFKKYPVRTGRGDYMTPVGDYTILNKEENPPWSDPKSHRRYGGGDPENELGTRWMSFQGTMLGIHGTIHPESVELYSSNGCVGMLKEDVEELFDLVLIGTTVRIVGNQNPEIIKKTEAFFKGRQEATGE